MTILSPQKETKNLDWTSRAQALFSMWDVCITHDNFLKEYQHTKFCVGFLVAENRMKDHELNPIVRLNGRDRFSKKFLLMKLKFCKRLWTLNFRA